jgi:hypothetical protein
VGDVAAGGELDVDIELEPFAVPWISLNGFDPRRISEEASFHCKHEPLQALQDHRCRQQV